MHFIEHEGGDFVRANQALIVRPNIEDPKVSDNARIAVVLVGGFSVTVRCGDLRQALGITFDEVSS